MKKLYITLSIFLASLIYAQVPQAFSYQTIAFNAAGAPIANGNVNLRISILDNSATGAVLYTETHTKTTNSKGLVNLNIGQGTATTGNFGGINWGTNTKFVKVELDPAGGNNYTNVGVNQLMSVPYALIADKVNMNSGNSSLNDDILENKFSNYAFGDYYSNKINVYNSKTGNWSSQSYNANIQSTPAIIASNGNFVFGDYYSNIIYAYNSSTGNWNPQSYNANIQSTPTITISNGNFVFADYYSNEIYAYNSKTGNWSSQSYNANIQSSPAIVISESN